jgi:CheY-like chemotaxis protein
MRLFTRGNVERLSAGVESRFAGNAEARGMKTSPSVAVRFLIADDQKDFAIFLERLVCALGHEVSEVITSGGLSVIQAYEKHRPDAVLMDFHMPQFNGMTACRHILSKHPDARIIVMSGDTNLEGLAVQAGAVAAIRKPFSGVELATLLDSLDNASAAPADAAQSEQPDPNHGQISDPPNLTDPPFEGATADV